MKKVWSAGLILCAICSLMVTGAMLSGCGGGGTTKTDSVTRDAPTELYGQWRLVRTSGGIFGGGYPVTPETETLTFNQDGVFFRTVNGESIRGTYQVTRRQTPFGEGAMPVITYSNTTLTDVISQVGDQPLVLNEEAADGYMREYERVIMTGK